MPLGTGCSAGGSKPGQKLTADGIVEPSNRGDGLADEPGHKAGPLQGPGGIHVHQAVGESRRLVARRVLPAALAGPQASAVCMHQE